MKLKNVFHKSFLGLQSHSTDGFKVTCILNILLQTKLSTTSFSSPFLNILYCVTNSITFFSLAGTTNRIHI